MEKANLTTHITLLIPVRGNKTSNMYRHQKVQTVSKKAQKGKRRNLSPLIPSPSPQGNCPL